MIVLSSIYSSQLSVIFHSSLFDLLIFLHAHSGQQEHCNGSCFEVIMGSVLSGEAASMQLLSSLPLLVGAVYALPDVEVSAIAEEVTGELSSPPPPPLADVAVAAVASAPGMERRARAQILAGSGCPFKIAGPHVTVWRHLYRY